MTREPFTRAAVIAVTFSCVSLAACNTVAPREPVVRTVEVKVPVAVPCPAKGLDLNPAFPDTNGAVKASAGPGDLLQLLAAGRLLRDQWIAEARAALRSCRPADPG